MPKLVPAHREVIFASGVAEILCAAGLLCTRLRGPAGWASAALLLAVYPANLKMAGDAAQTDSTTFKAIACGRLPLQLPLICTACKAAAASGSPWSKLVGRRCPASLAPMILRMSSLFVRTLRDDPADAEVPSHRLLVRAGYIRRAAPGHLHLAAAGPAGAAQHRGDHPRGDGRDRRPGAAVPRAAAARALRGDRPLDGVRRRHLPAQGPQGRRLPARPHARGDVHARR